MTWDHLGPILGHPEAVLELSSESWWATWVQCHLAEMPKSLSLGPMCSENACMQHASAYIKHMGRGKLSFYTGFICFSEHLHLNQEKHEPGFH